MSESSSPPGQPGLPQSPEPAKPASILPVRIAIDEPTRRLWIGGAMGVIYGIILQLLVRTSLLRPYFELMSVGLVFLMPMAIGFLVVYLAALEKQRSIPFALTAPVPTILTCLAVALAVGWEGGFCLLFATPVFLVMAALGGLLALGVARLTGRGRAAAPLAAIVLLLPLTSGFVESGIRAQDAQHHVHTMIPIRASADKVWSEIIRVRPITEPTSGFFYKIGFPKPIEATLSHPGVGGVRNASFQKGLLFIETVDEWVPEKRISFSIKPDAHQTRLDPHVVVGGQYFDVLRGTYEVERLPNGEGVILHLWSHFRVSTHFNAYAGFLGTTLMRDIQDSILRVIQQRCEAP